MPATYVNIASQTTTGTVASVTFSSIPQTYTDLVLRFDGRGNDAAINRFIRISFNGDTGSNYSYRLLGGTGSATNNQNGSNVSPDTPIGYITGGGSTANVFGSAEIYIPGYTSTSSRPFSGFTATENNATTAYVSVAAGLYRGTSAISSITLAPQGVSFVSGSSFYLYGIKNS